MIYWTKGSGTPIQEWASGQIESGYRPEQTVEAQFTWWETRKYLLKELVREDFLGEGIFYLCVMEGY